MITSVPLQGLERGKEGTNSWLSKLKGQGTRVLRFMYGASTNKISYRVISIHGPKSRLSLKHTVGL